MEAFVKIQYVTKLPFKKTLVHIGFQKGTLLPRLTNTYNLPRDAKVQTKNCEKKIHLGKLFDD